LPAEIAVMSSALRCCVIVCVSLALSACSGAARVQPISAAPSEPAPREEVPPLELALPVEDVWVVSQGYHGAHSHKGRAAYALDLVKLDEHGRAYARSGKRTQDWFGFGAEVRASADGIVVRAIDRFADNRVWGKGKDSNTVIVRHGAVWSEYVHLQQGSLRVREGERVVRGQVLARCGNSGAETPHLHWALLSSLEPIRTRPAPLAPYEVRDANGAWRMASAPPRVHEVVRSKAP
jgi:murein DD-endopeptidase MepM/ murein hydrolase activator NlpD